MVAMKIVVAGFGATGSVYALLVKKLLGEKVEVVALEASGEPPYSRCGLPYVISGIIAEKHELYYQNKEYYEENGIRVYYNAEVTEIDTGSKEVTIKTGKGYEKIGYDILGYALGVKPLVPPIEGLDSDRVTLFYTLNDAWRTRKLASRSRKVLVIGAGPTGYEVASELSRLRLSVDVVFMEPWPLYTMLDKDMARRVVREERFTGINLHPSRRVVEIKTLGDSIKAVMDDGYSIQADFAVLATGMKPNTDIAAKAGLPIGESGGLSVDEHLRVKGYDDIYGVGTVIEYEDPLLRRKVFSMLGSFGIKTAMMAAYNTSGFKRVFRGGVKASITKGFKLFIGSAGITSIEALAAGYKPVSQLVVSNDKAHYMPDHDIMITKLIADEKTGRILGVQVIGSSPSVKGRVDTVSAIIGMGATVYDLADSDWGYTPCASDAWEPLVVAANKLLEKLA